MGQTTAESPEEPQVNGNASNIVLRKREYRTARHMALIETQISRRTSGVALDKTASTTTAEDASQQKRRSLFGNAIDVDTTPKRSPVKLMHAHTTTSLNIQPQNPKTPKPHEVKK